MTLSSYSSGIVNCTSVVLDVVKLPAAVVHVVVWLRFKRNLFKYFMLNIDALAPESNRIRIVWGFGLPNLVRILAKRIGTRSFWTLSCPLLSLLWPASVDLIEYILSVMQLTRLI
jgi:hypothetical protein